MKTNKISEKHKSSKIVVIIIILHREKKNHIKR